MATSLNLHPSFSLPFIPLISTDTRYGEPSLLKSNSFGSHTSLPGSTDQRLPLNPSLAPPPLPRSPTLTSATSSTANPYRLCTLCHHRIKGPNYSFPSVAPAALAAIKLSLSPQKPRKPPKSDERHFCQKCWIRIYNLSLCWTCGDIVHRGEERVGFGWCWWHWGCLGCLFCRVGHFLDLVFLTMARGDSERRTRWAK